MAETSIEFIKLILARRQNIDRTAKHYVKRGHQGENTTTQQAIGISAATSPILFICGLCRSHGIVPEIHSTSL